jgi:membrane protein implicated in regulation of membrane protease activity
MVTMGLFFAPFAFGAALAAMVAAVGAGLVPSFVSFAIASALFLLAIRPFVVSHRRVRNSAAPAIELDDGPRR